jgi:hypothetical protein
MLTFWGKQKHNFRKSEFERGKNVRGKRSIRKEKG